MPIPACQIINKISMANISIPIGSQEFQKIAVGEKNKSDEIILECLQNVTRFF